MNDSVPNQPPSSHPVGDARRLAPPGDFARIFLAGIDKYRARKVTADTGSILEEASADLAHIGRPKGSAGRSLRTFVEAVVVSGAVLGIGFAIDRSDPFFLRQRFSWLVVAPLLVGLRHGFAAGCASAFLIDGVVVGALRSGVIPDATSSAGPTTDLPGGMLMGIVLVGMLAGQFSDVWRREITRLDGGFRSLRRQLNEALRAHFLLELSHDRLYAQQGGTGPNLREAILSVRNLAEDEQEVTLAMLGPPIQEVFGEYCLVESAALHAVHQLSISPKAVVAFGGARDVDPRDALLRQALTHGQLAVLPVGFGSSGTSRDAKMVAKSRLLAAVPFVDTSNTVRGVLCVEAMPLVAFDRRNLQTLFMLGGHFADLLAAKGGATELERGRRKEFEVRLGRALRDLVVSDVPASILGLRINRASPVVDLLDDLVTEGLHQLDFPLVLRTATGVHVVLILLPMTESAETLTKRFEERVERELKTSMSNAQAELFSQTLRKSDTVNDVMRALERKARLR